MDYKIKIPGNLFWENVSSSISRTTITYWRSSSHDHPKLKALSKAWIAMMSRLWPVGKTSGKTQFLTQIIQLRDTKRKLPFLENHLSAFSAPFGPYTAMDVQVEKFFGHFLSSMSFMGLHRRLPVASREHLLIRWEATQKEEEKRGWLDIIIISALIPCKSNFICHWENCLRQIQPRRKDALRLAIIGTEIRARIMRDSFDLPSVKCGKLYDDNSRRRPLRSGCMNQCLTS